MLVGSGCLAQAVYGDEAATGARVHIPPEQVQMALCLAPRAQRGVLWQGYFLGLCGLHLMGQSANRSRLLPSSGGCWGLFCPRVAEA